MSLNSSGELALVGGVDGVAGIYSLPEKRIVATLKGGGGSITDTLWVGNKAAVATSTGAVKVFEDGSEIASFNTHAGEATALAVHPTGDIIASVGVDKSYVLYDLATSTVVTQIFSDTGKDKVCQGLFLSMLTLFYSSIMRPISPRRTSNRGGWSKWPNQNIRC